MNVILLFPGQGSQKQGMGSDLAAAFPAARETFQRIDDTLGVALSSLCFNGPQDELTLTKNAQPALYAHGAAIWAVVRDMLANRVVAAAGHSLGELTAYHAADSLKLEHGAALVRKRGQIMFDIGSERPGTMAAILGRLATPIEDLCAQATREAGLVVAANYNDDEQVVVSGEPAGVERVMELARAAGARRALKLAVSGAFHSPLMEPTEIAFSGALGTTEIADPEFPVYSNVTGEACTAADQARTLLLRQLTSPVKWSTEVRAMASAYPDSLYVELGPGRVLGGLVSRIVPGARTIAVGTAADVDSLAGVLG